jgi:hypothetical protein
MESAAGVIAETGVIRSEVAEREAVQMPAVCGIAKRAEVRVVGSCNVYLSTRTKEAMKFLHCAYDVGDMFNHVDGTHVVE